MPSKKLTQTFFKQMQIEFYQWVIPASSSSEASARLHTGRKYVSSCQYLFLTPSHILGSVTLIGSGTNCVDSPRLASSRFTISL